MKKLGAILYFTRQRNEDLMRAYRFHLHNSSHIHLPAIYRRVAQTPAARFWVSEERAAIIISAMEAGRPLPKMRPNKKEMFEEIHRRYLILKEQFPEKTLPSLVAEVVCQPAPKFYLTPKTVKEFICRIKTGFYK